MEAVFSDQSTSREVEEAVQECTCQCNLFGKTDRCGNVPLVFNSENNRNSYNRRLSVCLRLSFGLTLCSVCLYVSVSAPFLSVPPYLPLSDSTCLTDCLSVCLSACFPPSRSLIFSLIHGAVICSTGCRMTVLVISQTGFVTKKENSR